MVRSFKEVSKDSGLFYGFLIVSWVCAVSRVLCLVPTMYEIPSEGKCQE